MTKSVRRASDFPARYGGEKFILLLPNTSRAGAIEIAEIIRLQITNSHFKHSHSKAMQVATINVGPEAMIPSEKNAVHSLVKTADLATARAF